MAFIEERIREICKFIKYFCYSKYFKYIICIFYYIVKFKILYNIILNLCNTLCIKVNWEAIILLLFKICPNSILSCLFDLFTIFSVKFVSNIFY